MLDIECPWCGKRANTEFVYEGDATVSRPNDGDERAFFEYVYIRENPSGWHDEIWQHVSGCRRFIKVRRNVTTHEVAGTAKPGDELPSIPGSGESK